MKRSKFALPFWVGLFLFSIYLLSFSGKLHVMDELAVFTAGNNLAQHGRADINQLIWTNHWTPHPPGIWGQDGNLYTKKAPGISFITVPLIWLGHALPGLNAIHVALLTNSILTAFTAGLLFVWLVDLGYSRPAATFTALGYGLCTIAWVYARMFWGLSVLGLCFLVAVWAARRAVETVTDSGLPVQNYFQRSSTDSGGTATRMKIWPSPPNPLSQFGRGGVAPATGVRAYFQRNWGWLLLSGAAVALGLTLRFEAGMAVVLVSIYLFVEFIKSRQYLPLIRRIVSTLPYLGLYLLPTLIVALGLAYFNFIRYGGLSETGYTQEILFKEPWVGGFGLLFSPGNGLLLFAPFMLLLFFGLVPAWQRLSRPYFLLIAALSLFYWIFYGSWFAWGGTWGWGPRFFLPTLPLLMLFVAEPLHWLFERRASRFAFHLLHFTFHTSSRLVCRLAWLGVWLLVALSLFVNFLGVAVDMNEHFLRLGRNDDFTFNWAAFPPLGHWQILQDGLVDIIWLKPNSDGVLSVVWPVLLPALVLFGVATIGAVVTYLSVEKLEVRNENLDNLSPVANKDDVGGVGITRYITSFVLSPFSFFVTTLLAIYLTGQMMLGTAQVALADEQAQSDLPVLELLASAARPDDALLVPMPPFGDVWEISTLLMAYLDRPLPTYAWIESEPRAIQPDERGQVWQAATLGKERVWLFERWLTPSDPAGDTSAHFKQQAFPVREQWFEQSGKLTLYALAQNNQLAMQLPLDVPFQGGLNLVDFSAVETVVMPGDVLKVRLTWHMLEGNTPATGGVPAGGVIGFVHLLNETGSKAISQQDLLLLDTQHIEQSPLHPGETVVQGYGLQLPDDVPPGSYPLIAGLYLANSGQPLVRADGSPDGFIYLTNITIQ